MGSYSIGGETISVAANSTSAEQLTTRTAILPYDALVEVGLTASATGMRATVLAVGNPNGESILVDSPISLANRFPLYPDDMAASFVAKAGTVLSLTFRNTTGGALNAFFLVKVTQVA